MNWPGQRPPGPARPGAGLPIRLPGRLWLIGAGALVVLYVLAQLLSGALSPSGGAGQATPAPADNTGYLAAGYAQLSQTGATSSSGSFWGLWASMLIPLAIVIVCVYAILRGLRYVNARMATTSHGRVLESIDTLSLGQQGTIHLVRIGSRVVVVGAGSHQITLLAELDSEEEAEILQARRERGGDLPIPARGVLQSFQDLVTGRLSPRPAPGQDDEAPHAVEVVDEPDAVRLDIRPELLAGDPPLARADEGWPAPAPSRTSGD